MEKDLNDENLSFEQTRLERLMLAKTAIQAHISNNNTEDDDDLILSEEARLALLSHLEEACKSTSEDAFVEEDWELSQFWYDEETALTLAKAAVECVGEKGRIACVSSPSVYNQLQKLSNSKEHYLFEFDKRFQDKFPEQTIFYDYKTPLELDPKFQMYFDVVIADPPFLSQECLEKFTQTINFLTEKKIILCTGAVMEDDAKKLLNLIPCNFKPQHEKKLGNEFKCYANFNLDEIISHNKS
ncbi:EEF1A lysine methyltransferase 1 [Trichonephila inaurata madagascariensis]|uniref:Protein-lysine N-methyltransferase TNIN_331071 n=1 Tax=Trichonephila inaurata madagascariensis TaxID=2747483 RepID=A0A8X6YIB7_9ARAC|nr:EEF1A lysine methyltransferase 1 [Trichonephila inaurata madagascariensis]